MVKFFLFLFGAYYVIRSVRRIFAAYFNNQTESLKNERKSETIGNETRQASGLYSEDDIVDVQFEDLDS